MLISYSIKKDNEFRKDKQRRTGWGKKTKKQNRGGIFILIFFVNVFVDRWPANCFCSTALKNLVFVLFFFFSSFVTFGGGGYRCVGEGRGRVRSSDDIAKESKVVPHFCGVFFFYFTLTFKQKHLPLERRKSQEVHPQVDRSRFLFFHLCVSHPSAPSNDDPPSVLCMWNGWPKDPKKLFPPYYFLWKESAIFLNISLYPSHFISIKHFEFVVLEECCVSSFTKPSILCVFFVFSFVCFAHW